MRPAASLTPAIFVALVAACGGAGSSAATGPACTALLELAARAEACDPALGDLAQRVAQSPDEPGCRIAARALIDGGPPDREPRLRSVFEPADSTDTSLGATPLSATELRTLADLPLPARIELSPDLRPGPGVPATTADIDRTPLEADLDGSLRGDVAPGARTLELRHAGREALYCIEVRACETMRVVAHGARLAKHPQVRPGPC